MPPSEHDNINIQLISYKLEQLELVTETSAANVSKLVDAIHEQSKQIGIMIERHDQVSVSNSRLWGEVEKAKDRLTALELISAEDRLVIRAVKNINKQVVTVVVAALLGAVVAPAAVVSYLLSNPPQPAVRADQTTQTQKVTHDKE